MAGTDLSSASGISFTGPTFRLEPITIKRSAVIRVFFKSVLGNLSSKNRLRDRFLARNLDRLLVRVFSGTNFRQEARHDEERGDRTCDRFSSRTGYCLSNLSSLKNCYRVCLLSLQPVLLPVWNSSLKKPCPVTCLDFELKNLSLSLFFEDRLPRPAKNPIFCVLIFYKILYQK